MYGIELATIINKTMDKNIKNEVTKDENGIFIQNNDNSINLEIYMKDNETTYKMETIYNGGTEQFVQYYRDIKFKCSPDQQFIPKAESGLYSFTLNLTIFPFKK